MKKLTIAHLSDIHYAPDEISDVAAMLKDRGLLIETLLPACLAHLRTVQPDIVLITGDLTHEADVHAYRYLRKQFEAGLPGVPVFCAAGNHDTRGAFREGFLGMQPDGSGAPMNRPYHDRVVVNGWQFVSLDSAHVDGTKGIFTTEAMDYLEQCLTEAEAQKLHGTFLLMHHPILAKAGRFTCLLNDRLEQLLRSGRITAIFNGHIHGSYTSTVCGVPQFTAESFKTDFDILPDCISYNNRCGYQIIQFDDQGDWFKERFIQNPKPHTFFTKP